MKHCGRTHYRWPWWCSREITHDGPCALWKKWYRIGG